MKTVRICVETDSIATKKTHKYYAYILEYAAGSGLITRDGFGELDGTYHRAILSAIVEAAERLKEPCEVRICAKDNFVLSMITRNMKTWSENGFLTEKRKPLINQDLWMRLWEATKGGSIIVEHGEHEYSAWLKREIERRKQK